MIVKGSECVCLPCDENDVNYKRHIKDAHLFFYEEYVEKAISIYNSLVEKPDSIILKSGWGEVLFEWECEKANLEVILMDDVVYTQRIVISLDRYCKNELRHRHNELDEKIIIDENVSAENIISINKAISKYIAIKEGNL